MTTEESNCLFWNCRPHPAHLRLTTEEQARLDTIKAAAKVRHEKARKAAAARGRHDFPDSPFECSWAYELQFFREERVNDKTKYYLQRDPHAVYLT